MTLSNERKIITYCVFCSDYFENIKQHHYINHESKISDYDLETKTTKYALIGLHPMFEHEVLE